MADLVDTNIVKVKDAAMLVGAFLEKGRSECIYQKALSIELNRQGIQTLQEEIIPIKYTGDAVIGFERSDIVLPDLHMVLELKVAPKITTDHHWQLVHYLKAKQYQVGMVINFSNKEDSPVMVHVITLDGESTVVHNLNTGDLSTMKSISF